MHPITSIPWRIFVDTGGTFTDAVAIAPSGDVRRAKVLSSSALRARVLAAKGDTLHLEAQWGETPDLVRGWEALPSSGGASLGRVRSWEPSRGHLKLETSPAHTPPPGTLLDVICPDEAPILAARVLTATPGDRTLPLIHLRLATTRGTNALLTRRFARPVLFITAGLEDLLTIGTQQRSDASLFSLDIRQPERSHDAVIGVWERLSAAGAVVRALNRQCLIADAERIPQADRAAAAVALLHADVNGEHERDVASVLRELGFGPIALSHEVSPLIKLLPRATTAVIEAALAPVVSDYVDRIEAALGPGSRLDVLSSAGGLTPSRTFRAKDSLLSGPAGGVVGAAAAADTTGETEIFAFDMGGTSTDVSHWSRQCGVEHTSEHAVGETLLVSPAVRVHTVAAGGGSICGFDTTALTVGPMSAGADPGPACYRRGGPFTVTDVQLLAGRMIADGLGVPLDVAAAELACEQLLDQMATQTGRRPNRDDVLDGLLDVAAERIAGAIRIVATSRGHDPSRASLLAFGGAGGQIACLVAERLKMPRVIVPPDAGLLSARGLMHAGFQAIAQRQVLEPLSSVSSRLPRIIDGLRNEACAKLVSHFNQSDTDTRPPRLRIDLALRWAGQETSVEIECPTTHEPEIRSVFVDAYRRQYGYTADRDAASLELVWVRVVANTANNDVSALSESAANALGHLARRDSQSMRSRGRASVAPVIQRRSLFAGEVVEGPALIVEEHCTTVIEDGWTLNVLADGTLSFSPQPRQAAQPREHARIEAAEVELYTSRFESAARTMGAALQRTSVSVNVKERLDYSCAVLDSRGRLVACAPHVPVHLGSLGVCVREVCTRVRLARGDVVVTNHPACGGSHLPDVTVISAAFADDPSDNHPIAYVAARAHHAEIGGIRPGSMPPDARFLADEGVVIAPMFAVRAGAEQLDAVRAILASGMHGVPSRAVETNLEDLRAAIAACRSGIDELESVARDSGRLGESRFAAMMEAIQIRSARAAESAIAALGDFNATLTDTFDDGEPLQVRLHARDGQLHFDFTGTADVHRGNLNATPAIVNSCLVYVMRVLVGRDLPLNEGLMRPVQLVLPRGMLNPPFSVSADPRSQPAVVGGNVETSPRIVNLILHGLGLCAESQGTMNNLIFGDSARSYYETIGGGAGAGPGFQGASAVHTHMTNTRITDPEILERRYPVRLERFAIRRDSGGDGEWRGGDGIERVIRFLAPMSISVLTQRRIRGPRGASGGNDGQPGAQWIERRDGARQELAWSEGTEVGPGDAIIMHTPGGGGFGRAPTGPRD